MFFRRTKVANGLDGKSYYTYRLVENQRESTKFRQKTVLNLGANWDVPQSDWKAVSQRVEAIQHGQISCFEYPKRVESAAQSVVNRLLARDLNGDKLGTGSVVTVDLDTMNLNSALEFDAGQSWSMFSHNIGSLKADCSTKAHHQMGEPFSNFPNTGIVSTSTSYPNSVSSQLMNLGSRYLCVLGLKNRIKLVG